MTGGPELSEPDTAESAESAELAELAHGDAVDLLACQTRVLALMSSGAALSTMLDAITDGLERLMPSSRCSLLLLDMEGALRHGSAPSLPADYLAAIDGLVPGPQEGSCGTAAHLVCAVVVPDISTDARWDKYRSSAQAAGLRACWSTPVLGNTAAVIGTFAVYHQDVHHPTPREQRIVERLSYLASVAIEHAAMIGAVTVNEERFRRAFEDNAVAMALLDPAGTVTRANDALRHLAGVAIDAGTTTLVDILEDGAVDGAGDGGIAALLRDVRAERVRDAQCEAGVRGRDRTVSLTMSLVRGASGEPLQVSVNMLDITERLAAQRERRARLEAEVAQRSAEAASRAKSAFLSAVSHEMRTPLQAITGFAELLATLDLDAERRAEALHHVAAGAGHLLELVDDTLDLARIEANALPLTLQPLPVAGVIAGVLDLLAPVADEYGVELVAQPQAGVVHADERRLRQVLINLVSNGIRYSGPAGVVRVGATAGTNGVRITVADNGPGIDPELRGRLFEPFVHTPSDSGDGVGLGLMLARGLTEAMGGRLTIDDVPGGPGTLATLSMKPA